MGLHGKALIQNGSKWNVSFRNDISIWSKAWIPSLSGFKVNSPKHLDCNLHLVRDLIYQQNGQWKHDNLSSLFSEEEQKVIQCIHTLRCNGLDKII